MDRESAGLLVLVIPLFMSTSPLASPPAAPVDLSGTWSLDTYLSDHSEQIARAIQFDIGEFTPETVGRGAEPMEGSGRRDGDGRVPFGGGGRAGRAQGPPADRLKPEERKLLAELTRPVEFPPTTLAITQGDTSVTITAGQRTPDVFRTDGKSEKRSLEAGTVNRTAVWEGPYLRVAYDMGRAGTLTYTYSIVPTTRQLLIRVNVERVPGNPGPFEIKLVYNRTTPPAD